MPQRQSIITYDSTEVQGEGSWIKVRLVTHGEQKQILKEYGGVAGKSVSDIGVEATMEMSAANDRLVASKIFDWNWVDDEGDPLPLPKDDPTVIDQLTEFEHSFIASAMRGEGERKK